jgi:preprotein translocase subunit SecG
MAMRLVRLVIWLATLFFALMLFLPLVRQIIRQLSDSGISPGP